MLKEATIKCCSLGPMTYRSADSLLTAESGNIK